MKIQRRNRSELSIAAVAILFIVLPSTFFSNSFTLTDPVLQFIPMLIGSFIFAYYLKQFQLSKAEIKYIENEADCIIERKKINRGNYSIVMIFFVMLLITDPILDRFYFVLNLLTIIALVVFFGYQEVTKTNFNLERLLFLKDQIVYLGDRQKVINLSDIEGLYLKETNLYIREKYGILEFCTEDLQEIEKQKLRLRIFKISNELSLDSKYVNISL